MRLLMVEDDLEMAAALSTALHQNGLVVDHVTQAESALEALEWNVHDIVLLDRQLPDGDGLKLLPAFRRVNPNIPIVMLTAHDELQDRVAGLDGGADDYVGKPFRMGELMARIRALLRRPPTLLMGPTRYGNLSFDHQAPQAFVDNAPLDLPRRELLVLQILLKRLGRTVVRSAIEEAVYGFDEAVQSNALDSHVSRLRRKLADAGAEVTIHGIRGVGYLMKSGKP